MPIIHLQRLPPPLGEFFLGRLECDGCQVPSQATEIVYLQQELRLDWLREDLCERTDREGWLVGAQAPDLQTGQTVAIDLCARCRFEKAIIVEHSA